LFCPAAGPVPYSIKGTIVVNIMSRTTRNLDCNVARVTKRHGMKAYRR